MTIPDIETPIAPIPEAEWYQDYLKKCSTEEKELLNNNFLPKEEGLQTDRIRLIFLTMVQSNNLKTTLTESAEKACKASLTQRKTVKWSIILGLGITTLIFSPLAYLSLQNNILATSTAVMVQTILSTAFSYYATGIAPYYASNRDNETQNEIRYLEQIYNHLGARLLQLYYHNKKDRTFAIEVVKKIDYPTLLLKTTLSVKSEALSEHIFKIFKVAKNHIENQGDMKVLKNHILLYTTVKILRKKYLKNHQE